MAQLDGTAGARPRTIVVGAGCFGLSAALELIERGHQVLVLEAGTIPAPRAASTDLSKLVRADYGRDRLYAEHATEAIGAWRRWNARLERPLFHETGLLVLRPGPLEPGSFEGESAATLLALGYPLEPLEPATIAARYRAFATREGVHGYFNPQAGWVESGEVIRAWAAIAAARGAVLRPRTPVLALERPGRVRIADGSQLHADHVVVALGAQTSRLLPELAGSLQAVAQPVVHLAPPNPHRFTPPQFPPWAFDIARTGWYGFPAAAGGVVKIGHHGRGQPVDPTDYDDRALPAGHLERLRGFLAQTIPALADAPVQRTRICLYCDTTDGHFWIDRHPSEPWLTVAAGGSGHAFKFAPVLGRWIADALEGRPNRTLARFRWRTDPTRTSEREAARCT